MGVCVWVYTPDWQGPVSFPPVHLSLGHWIPAEIQLPVKAPIGHVRAGHVLECVITDHINDGTHTRTHTHTHVHTDPNTQYHTVLYPHQYTHRHTIHTLANHAHTDTPY